MTLEEAAPQTQSMTREGRSVLFAALLLVAQLFFGVMSAGAVSYHGTHHCGGCPTADSGGMAHDIGSSSGDCESHCSDGGSSDQPKHGCGSGCTMAGSSHCGSSANPALNASPLVALEVATAAFEDDRGAVGLRDSPLFDFLRPPTRD